MITPSFGLTATERVLPKLALDFTTASLDSRITFTRALNTATRVNASGLIENVNADLPRFDYDPVTLICKGLLIEESRQNIVLNSEALNSWSSGNVTVSTDAAISPSGVQNAEILNDGIVATTHDVSQVVALTGGVTYTMSAYFKNIDRRYVILACSASANSWVSSKFDLQTASVGSIQAAGAGNVAVSAKVDAFNNGYYRCVFTFTPATTGNYSARIGMATDGTTYSAGLRGLESYTGSNKTVIAWGAQLEAGAFATSYIPTTSAALTRNADVATMTGTNFSSWFNASEGTFTYKYAMVGVKSSSAQRVLQTDDGTDNSRMANFLSSVNGVQISITNPSGINGSLNPPTVTATPNTFINQGFAYKLNNSQGAANSGISATDTTVDIPTVTTLRIAQSPAGAVLSCLWISDLYYWPQRITGAELATFTK